MEGPPLPQQQPVAQQQHPQQPPTKLMVAVHTVATATAKVPFCMILLLDFAKRRAAPAGCKCRMVVPSDGTTSFSLWDVADPETLLQWLGDNLGGDCITQLHEVQEDFTWGLSLELARMRAAERVMDGSLSTIGVLGETTSKAAGVLAAGVSTAVGSTQQRLADFDERTGVVTAAKETTTAIAIKALDVLDKAAADKRVQSVVATAGTGWAKLSTWVGERVRDIGVGDGAGAAYAAPAQHARSFSPATQGQVHMPAPYVGPGEEQQHFSLGGGGGSSSGDGSLAQAPAASKQQLPATTPAAGTS